MEVDKEQEELLVKTFFEKRVRERILHELFSPKKRQNVFHRLCHNFNSILSTKYMIEITKPNSDPDKIVSLLHKYGAIDSCYVIAMDSDLDCKYIPLSIAVEKVIESGWPTIISCIPSKLAFFPAEQDPMGLTPRNFLKR
ncbi:hypothetical protein ABH17_028300 (plasmid) [Bacillus toyonensis]|uniref:hypothetical protein n=1 Tax=Bacillus toyonensis TaxID=155322 RepID=UPI0006AA0D5B|nr:hypothetical protein [Bacillus toyonensis]OKO50692.1 hypothetical protein ABH17_028300 [Bacillus toyonensis]